MTVYVDQPIFRWKGQLWCHLFADTDDELHVFARQIGLRREWHQRPPKASWSHYDINLPRRAAAIRAGAVATDKYGAAYHVAKLTWDGLMLERIDSIRAQGNGRTRGTD